MDYILLIPSFIVLAIFIIFSKSDLYTHEHDSATNNEIETFKSNFEDLKNLDIENNYNLNNSHIYNNE